VVTAPRGARERQEDAVAGDGERARGEDLAGSSTGRRRLRDRLRGSGSDRTVRLAAFVWLAVGLAALGWVAYRLLWPVVAVIGPPLLLAGLIVYALDPIVAALSRGRLPRWVATLLTYLGLLTILSGLVAVAAPLVGNQVADLAEEVPDLRGRGKDLLEQGFGALGMDVRLSPAPDGEEIAREVADEAERALGDEATRERITGALGGLAGVAAGTARLLLLLLLAPVVAFYLLADLPRIRRSLRSLLPPDRREELAELAGSVGRVAGGYVRGQLLIAAIVGAAATAGFALIGLPFWAVIGLIAGVSNLVPFVGPVVGGLVGVVVALLTDGFGLAVAVVVVVTVVQQIESQLLQPLIMGRTVEIHPVVVLLAVVVGGGLFGLVGLLLAVPAVAAGNVVAAHLWNRHVPWAEGAPPPSDAEGAAVRPVTREG
jgi:predicted PurR-regulated permease PerM